MVYKGKEYFVAANTQSLNGTTNYSYTDINNMCINNRAQIVARPRPENGNRTKAILAFLQPIATKVGNHLHVWAARSRLQHGVDFVNHNGYYVVHPTDWTKTVFRKKHRVTSHAFLALCERGESSINTTCTL